MHTLTGQDCVHLWEVGLRQHPLDRALTILMAAFPEVSREQLALLSISRRDAYLFALRERTFGSRLRSMATCLNCGQQSEFTLDTADLPIATSIAAPLEEYALEADDHEVHFRLPNSLDLAAIIGYADMTFARMELMRRCIVTATKADSEISLEEVPAPLLSAMVDDMDAREPLALVDIPLDCSSCGQQWTQLFDIVSFFWTEIAVQSRRLLREVHTLASHYGWSEADILAMSAVRRQLYMEMVM